MALKTSRNTKVVATKEDSALVKAMCYVRLRGLLLKGPQLTRDRPQDRLKAKP